MTTTWTKFRSISLLGLILALTWTGAAPAAGQTTVGAMGVEEVHDRTARMLEREAEARAGNLETYDEASELYRKAAYIRGQKDPRAIADLRSAARLAHYEGRHELAVKDLTKAGDLARELRMPNETLDAYYEAAWVAQRTGQHDQAYRLVQRIGHLSRDPSFMIEVEPAVVARVMRLTAQAG